MDLQLLGTPLSEWLKLLGALGAALALGHLVAALALGAGKRVASRTDASWDDALIDALRGPTRFVLSTFAAWPAMRVARPPAPIVAVLDRWLAVLLVLALGWLATRLVGFVAQLVERRATHAAQDEKNADLRLRGLRTQILVLRRVTNIVLGGLSVAIALVQFDQVRTVGLSLLASAGMAGVVLGLAAQKPVAALLAGIQLSITQPVRIGDTVIVENEWGTIEEINLTYVVVRIWDLRRLIVPMTRFLEQPFQNWTKVSPELLGTIFFYADYRLPVAEARAELDRIVEKHPAWDGKTKSVLVTDVKERTLEVRALISAANADDQWTLRCHVRERMIAWLAAFEGGRYLPRTRVDAELVALGATD